MTDEKFFEKIKEEQQKQKDTISALQKILEASSKKEYSKQNNHLSLSKKIKKMFDSFCGNPPKESNK